MCFSEMGEELVGEDVGGEQLGPGADTRATSETRTGMWTLIVSGEENRMKSQM